MPSKARITKHVFLKWLRRLRLRLRGEKGYRLIANHEDDTVSIEDTMLLLGDPYCEYHCSDPDRCHAVIHCEGLEKKLFGEAGDPFSELPDELLEQIVMAQPVSTALKLSQLNKHLRFTVIRIMSKIKIESLWVAAHEEEGTTIFTVEVQVAGNMETLRAQGKEDVFQCARNAFTTALFILRFFDCSQTVFGVRLNNCPIPAELMHMRFQGLAKFQRVKHVHWSYSAPRQLLRLLSAGAVFF